LDRANAYAALKQDDDALAELSRAVRDWPYVWDTWFWRGEFHYRRDQWALAVADYSKALQLNEGSFMAWHMRGLAHAAQKDWDKAVRDQTRAAELSPAVSNVWFHRGQAYAGAGRWDRALGDFLRALELEPKQTLALLEYLRDNGRTEDVKVFLLRALPAWEKLERTSPEDHHKLLAHGYEYGVLLFNMGKAREAERVATKAVEIWPGSTHPWRARGLARLALHEPEKAVSDFSKGMAVEPDDGVAAWCYLGRATAYAELKREGDALADLSRATELWPRLWDTWIWRGTFHADRQRWESAAADYSEALALNPKYWPGWQARGFVQGRLGRWDKALADYEKALELNPENAAGHNDVAWLLVTCPDTNRRNPARAAALARRAVELAPSDERYRTTLGVALYRAGDWKAAVETLKTSDEPPGDQRPALRAYFRAMGHWKLGQKEDAFRWYERAVQLTDRHAPRDDELRQLGSEAGGLLGILEKKAP
jgi:tetratricopeptide (TPR) repeat protein